MEINLTLTRLEGDALESRPADLSARNKARKTLQNPTLRDDIFQTNLFPGRFRAALRDIILTSKPTAGRGEFRSHLAEITAGAAATLARSQACLGVGDQKAGSVQVDESYQRQGRRGFDESGHL